MINFRNFRNRTLSNQPSYQSTTLNLNNRKKKSFTIKLFIFVFAVAISATLWFAVSQNGTSKVGGNVRFAPYRPVKGTVYYLAECCVEEAAAAAAAEYEPEPVNSEPEPLAEPVNSEVNDSDSA